MTEQTCDRCDEPTDEEHDCEECCESVCSRCMFSETLCKGCEASLEERATYPEEFES